VPEYPAAMPQAEQSGPIAVYGATGYTGRLVAAELLRRNADVVLAGRNRSKLAIVAEDLGGARIAVVPLEDEAGLRRLLEPCTAVIACAGPFRLHGEPVVAAAVDSGTHYLDTTGEQRFMRTVFEDYGPRAEAAGVALVPAMGFDYVPGDLIAALTAEGMGPLEEITLAYAVGGWDVIGPRATRGTARSALGIISEGDLEFDGGELREASGGVSRGTFQFPAPLGRQRMLRYPAGEHITVPRHVRTSRVRTMLTAATVMPHPRLARAAPALMPALSATTRTPLRRGLEALISRLPEGPTDEARERASYTVVCEAWHGSRHRRGIVRGNDVYGTTARTTVEGALLCSAAGYDRKGALAPAQAFDPREFLRSLREHGVTYEVAPAPG
jgi:short subunit dehydrogenase-like uncharacterized protein